MNACIHVRSAILRPQAEQRAQVVDVRVDAAARDEPEQVHVAAALLRAVERAASAGLSKNEPSSTARLTRIEVLVEDPARSRS